MPYVNVKLIKGVFDEDQKQEMLTRITETMVDIEGEAMRPVTLGDHRRARQRRVGHRRQGHHHPGGAVAAGGELSHDRRALSRTGDGRGAPYPPRG